MISFQLHAVNGNGLQVLQVYILGVPVTENTSWIDASPAKSGTLISMNQHKPATNVSLPSHLIPLSIALLTKSTTVGRRSNDRDLFKLC